MDRESALALIRHRCPELQPEDIASLAESRPVVAIDAVLADKVADVLERFEERLEQMEGFIAAEANEEMYASPPVAWQ